MQIKVEMIGLDSVLKKLKTLSEPEKIFDEAIKETAINAYRELITATIGKKNLKTGNTSRAWTSPFKTSPMAYRVENAYKSQDGQQLIAALIDQGHGVITPKRAKMLYIPLNRRGQMKPLYAKTTGLKRGVDFILAKKVRAMPGTNYLQKVHDEAVKELSRRVTLKVREAIK